VRALIFTNKPLLEHPVDEWLAGADERPVAIVDRKVVEGGDEDRLSRAFERVVVVENFTSWELELRAVELHASVGYERIAATTEFDVLRVARIREFLGLPGQSVASALAYRDKCVMKAAVAQAGIYAAPFRPLDSPVDLLDHCASFGYPAVVKPRRLGGSMEVQILADDVAVEEFLAAGHVGVRGRWMVESFVPGHFHHVDGLMADGRVVHCWVSSYLRGNADFLLAGRSVGGAMLARDDPRFDPLVALSRRVIAALPTSPEVRAFHLEAFVDGSDIVFCEIACRSGGGGIPGGHEHSFGINLLAENLRGQAGLAPLRPDAIGRPPGELTGFVLFPTRRGRLVWAPDSCPIEGVVDYQRCAGNGEIRNHPANVADAVAHCLIAGSDGTSLWQRVVAADDWWTESVRWEALAPEPTG
jgi:hypothetical protein